MLSCRLLNLIVSNLYDFIICGTQKGIFSHHSLSFYETICKESECRLMLRVTYTLRQASPFVYHRIYNNMKERDDIIISVAYYSGLCRNLSVYGSQQFTDLSSVSLIVCYPFRFLGKGMLFISVSP